MEIFGPTVFAARFPSALASVTLAVVVFHIGRSLFDDWSGIAAGFITLVMPALYWHGHGGRNATTDVFLLLFGTLFVWFVWQAQTDSRFLAYAGVAGGLAVMSKQLAAGVYLLVSLPVLVAVLRSARPVDIAEMAGIGALIVLPWNLYAYALYPARYLNQMLLEQSLGRLGTDHAPLHRQNAEMIGPFNPFYLRRFPLYVGPFIGSAVLGAGVVAYQAWRDGLAEARAGLFTIWWGVFPVLFFTVATSSTWIHYTMGGVVPICLLSGLAVSTVFQSVRTWLDGRIAPRVIDAVYVGWGAAATLLMFVVYPAHQNGIA
jgi:4-amino-4-deoxy-L-arabinose transferase-like glycosyltransferase